MSSRSMAAVALVMNQAAEGVAYSPRHGALCPFCGKRMRVTVTKPWEGDMRVRWHRCTNPACLLARLERAVKSVELEPGNEP